MNFSCKECDQTCSTAWCQSCSSKHFQNNFEKWTSKNDEIDKILQKVQLDAKDPNKVMEWIPYSRLLVKRQIAEGGFGIVYLESIPLLCLDLLHQVEIGRAHV